MKLFIIVPEFILFYFFLNMNIFHTFFLRLDSTIITFQYRILYFSQY